MCEFCVSHGEGKAWYLNMANYSRAVFERVNSEPGLTRYLMGFREGLATGTATAIAWRRRLPRLYKWIAYPLVTRRMKQAHFGQVVPLEDVEAVLAQFKDVVRLPCVCRRITTGREHRVCYGVGTDLTHVYAEVPDFSSFERVSAAEAAAHVRSLAAEGLVHSLWTFETPFIGGLCNCDRECMAWRFQVDGDAGKVMWKAEYVAGVDAALCTACGACGRTCIFDAVRKGPRGGPYTIDPRACYGCGACRASCKTGAISLTPRPEELGW